MACLRRCAPSAPNWSNPSAGSKPSAMPKHSWPFGAHKPVRSAGTRGELFGLHPVPKQPAPTFRRLSRYDTMGLIWLLQGRPVIGLTETTASIQGATAVLTYRKLNKPALGPLGDSLDEMGAAT